MLYTPVNCYCVHVLVFDVSHQALSKWKKSEIGDQKSDEQLIHSTFLLNIATC